MCVLLGWRRAGRGACPSFASLDFTGSVGGAGKHGGNMGGKIDKLEQEGKPLAVASEAAAASRTRGIRHRPRAVMKSDRR